MQVEIPSGGASKSPQEFLRTTRDIAVVHAEAFQLMLYRADDGSELWFWNSRDGVTPFGTSVDGKEYLHAMHGYPTRYQAALPDEADYVWVSYSREAWAEMQRGRYQAILDRGGETADHMRQRWPTIEGWIEAMEFEHGQPRCISRADYLGQTDEWAGKLTA